MNQTEPAASALPALADRLEVTWFRGYRMQEQLHRQSRPSGNAVALHLPAKWRSMGSLSLLGPGLALSSVSSAYWKDPNDPDMEGKRPEAMEEHLCIVQQSVINVTYLRTQLPIIMLLPALTLLAVCRLGPEN
jgi:hypothetical protein